ncbi:hypothetical protein IGI37_000327 [Enterococcus sp. AZ194]|uniref:hypothetical protein n=1 Tax=Enterococcus sp. AZ194 TaxID=2774629 RepID=UPI003F282E95
MYKKRIISNKILLITIIGIPLLVYGAYLLYEVIPTWDIFMGESTYSSAKNYSLKEQMIIFVLEWNAINLQTSFLAVAYPIFILLNTLRFKEDLHSYFVFGRNRFKNYYRALVHSMLGYAFISALSFTLGHILIYVTFNQITPLTTDLSLESTSYIFNHLLPSDFFEGRPMYYFITTAIINDLPIIFSYSLLFCVITLFTKDNLYLFVLVPLGISLVTFQLSGTFNLAWLNLYTPFTGYYSKITDIWTYTIYPLGCSVLGLLYFYRRRIII